MRANAVILIVIGLLLLVGAVGAAMPDKVVISGNSSWIEAGSGPSTYTVTVTNQSSGVQNAVVTFDINNTLGTFSPGTKNTDSNGVASSIFTVGTKSGTSSISIRVQYNGGADGIFDNTYSFVQNIDHASPYNVYFTHPNTGEVTDEVSFNLSITDRFGNAIDNRTGNHIITLQTSGPSSNDGGFNYSGGYPSTITPSLDANGNFTVPVKLTSKIGSNYVVMAPIGSINPQKTELIEAVSTGIPYSMIGMIDHGGSMPIGTEYFTINYILYDKYDNPAGNRSIWVNTTLSGLDEQKLLTSNSLGQIQLTYGPKTTVQSIPITAISINNDSVKYILTATFTPATASSMVLAINPQVMASRDIPNFIPANITGKVTDFAGNPVSGEIVTFQLSSPVYSPATVTVPIAPSFNKTTTVTTITAITDSDGNAFVEFYPGSFTIQQSDPNYSETASGTCLVSAIWNSKPSQNPDIQVGWKNYPYLTVMANATPQTVQVNDTVNISIQVKGDGYMMKALPIVVMLDLQTTSNMAAANDKITGASRLEDMQGSSKTFVDNLTPGQDQVGLDAFGDINGNGGFILNASYNFAQVKTNIDSLVTQGGAKNMKQSVDDATYRIINNPNKLPHEVRAIIVAGDQDPRDSGTIASYAQETWIDNDIRVFTILFVSSKGGSCDTGDTKVEGMYELSAAAGGKSYCIASKSAMDIAFADIAQTLRVLAGVNATMQLSFDNVQVNSTPINGGLVFTYVPETKTTWPNSTVTYKNQTDEWTPNSTPPYQLHFDIGTLHVGETWMTEFTLKVNQTGVIDIFGPGSTIVFNNGTASLNLPKVFITSVPNTTPLGVSGGQVDVSNLQVTKVGNITDFIPLSWNLKYSGTSTVTETISYSFNNGPWVTYSSISGIPPSSLFGYSHSAQIDVKKFPPGGYKVKVHAIAPDGEDTEETITITLSNVGVFIKLE